VGRPVKDVLGSLVGRFVKDMLGKSRKWQEDTIK
jgi:hypothetical protein